tara:strand:+ start:660 stop:1682 length:1023 start_codon:yes stop_codon:yes gene_type:complete
MSYKRFDQQDVVVSAESVTSPVWSNDQVTLTGFFTSSTQTGGTSGDFFFDIYQTGSSLSGARVQLSAAYADKKGSGSLLYNDNVTGKSPSSTVYGQYRSLALGDEDADFSFGGVTSEYFYILNIDRARYKEKLLPGSTDIVLGISGSSRRLNLTDNSNTITTTTFNDSGRVYELVSGTLGSVNISLNVNGYTNGEGSYGFLLPDIGVILLNGRALDATAADGGIDLGTNRQNNTAGNNVRLIYNNLRDGGSFRIQAEETISSNFVFVRARNAEFNYSTNPSLITGSGELRFNVMINSPQSFITTVGLYNDNNDLLAVAKLSRPLLKDFNKEALIRIKLDY